jgi:hypothetical protein
MQAEPSRRTAFATKAVTIVWQKAGQVADSGSFTWAATFLDHVGWASKTLQRRQRQFPAQAKPASAHGLGVRC